MRFTFENRTYGLSFTRRKFDVNVVRDGKQKSVRSKYPYTTVTLYERTIPGAEAIIATATVGCLPSDKYSNAYGRLHALQALTQILTRKTVEVKPSVFENRYSADFRTAMWTAFQNATGREPRTSITTRRLQELLRAEQELQKQSAPEFKGDVIDVVATNVKESKPIALLTAPPEVVH